MIGFGNLAQGISRYWDMPPIVIVGVPVGVDRLATFLIAMVVLALFAYFLQRTRTGRAMRAVSMDETGAQMAGIGLTRIYQLTLALSCGLASLAGAVLLLLRSRHAVLAFVISFVGAAVSLSSSRSLKCPPRSTPPPTR